MIKIIKDGAKEIVKCEKCGCTFSYEKRDVISYVSLNGCRKKYVYCPKCSSRFVIIQEKL